MRAWIGQRPQFNGREARVLEDFPSLGRSMNEKFAIVPKLLEPA
jgi:hypothetical protein